MTFTIRRMTELDIDNVYAIEQEVHIAPWSRDVLFDCVRVGYDCRVFEITDENNQTVFGGYIICRHNNRICHILNFCITKRLQSQGYGRKILQTVLLSLTKSGTIDDVVLEVRPSNKIALHLYNSFGFEQDEIKPAYYKDDKGIEDAILLKKKI